MENKFVQNTKITLKTIWWNLDLKAEERTNQNVTFKTTKIMTIFEIYEIMKIFHSWTGKPKNISTDTLS